MRHPRVLDRDQALLLVIDVQEAFRKVLPDFGDLTESISKLVRGCHILNVPVVVTEQYPRGLGRTVPELTDHLGEHKIYEKECFSSCGVEDLMNYLAHKRSRQIIVCGIEAHVCVNQTSHDLLHKGYSVHLITDAITSRSPRNKEVGIQKILSAGAVPSSVELALFEMLVESGTEAFKSVQKLVK